MKVYVKILGLVLVGLAIQLALAAGGKAVGDSLVSRAFTVAGDVSSLVSRAFTVSNNIDSIIVSRAFTVTSNTDSSIVSRAFTVTNNTDNIIVSRAFTVTHNTANIIVSRAFTVSSNTDNIIVSRAFTVVVNCDDGLDGLCPDCDEDGMPDGCELDCGLEGGPCFDFPDCGMSEDCDGNGVPDECQLPADTCGDQGGTCTINCDDCNDNCMVDACEIAACSPESPDFPFCNDCNLNGIPDGCDDPEDGIPDECIVWDGGAGDDHSWSAVDNWEGNQVPGSGGAGPEESVVIAGLGAEAILDIDVSIDSLRLGGGAILHIDRKNLPGDMIVESGGVILVEGELLVAHDREIDASGASVTIGLGGVYQADPEAKGLVSAVLDAGSIRILGGPLVEGGGGVMALSGAMEASSQGDMTLDTSDGKGDTIPPDLNVTGDGAIEAEGNFEMLSEVTLTYNSSVPLMLGGDFVNHSTVESANDFDWLDGALSMTGEQQPEQSIEAAGKNYGPWPIGLVNNFAFGTLTIKTGALVEIVDTFDNQQDGVVACDEAIYVSTLIVESGAVLITNGCNVYYEQLCDGKGCPGDIPGLGDDVLLIQEPLPADFNGDGIVGPLDLAILLGSWGPCEGCPQDFNGDGIVGPFDLASLLGQWTKN